MQNPHIINNMKEKIWNDSFARQEEANAERANSKNLIAKIKENPEETGMFIGSMFGIATGKALGEVAGSNILKLYDTRRINRSLGVNPFKGKDFVQIDKRLKDKGFSTVGPNPVEGIGSYHHPETGRKYYLDKAGKLYKEGIELKHVDIHRKNINTNKNVEKVDQLLKGTKLENAKKKYPLGDKLVEKEIKKTELTLNTHTGRLKK